VLVIISNRTEISPLLPRFKTSYMLEIVLRCRDWQLLLENAVHSAPGSIAGAIVTVLEEQCRVIHHPEC
jgi:hypothetical protein